MQSSEPSCQCLAVICSVLTTDIIIIHSPSSCTGSSCSYCVLLSIFYTHFIVAEDKYMSQKCRRYGVVFNVSRGYLNRVALAFGCGFVLVPLILRNNRVILFGGQSPYSVLYLYYHLLVTLCPSSASCVYVEQCMLWCWYCVRILLVLCARILISVLIQMFIVP